MHRGRMRLSSEGPSGGEVLANGRRQRARPCSSGDPQPDFRTRRDSYEACVSHPVAWAAHHLHTPLRQCRVADPIRVTSGQFSLRHDRPDEFSFFGADGFLLVRAQAALASSPGLNCGPCGSGMPLNLSTVMLFTTGLVG